MVLAYWIPACVVVYVIGLIITAVILCYIKPPADWAGEFTIGILSLAWPVVALGVAVGKFAKWFGLSCVDRLILKLSE